MTTESRLPSPSVSLGWVFHVVAKSTLLSRGEFAIECVAVSGLPGTPIAAAMGPVAGRLGDHVPPLLVER